MRFAEVGPAFEDVADAVAALLGRVEDLPISQRRPVLFSGTFGTIEAPARLETLRALIDRWTPDAVVYESADLAAPIAASEARIPFVHHAFGRPIPEPTLRMAAETVATLWQDAGLDPEPLAGAYRGSYVDICPPSLRVALPRRPLHTFTVRPVDAPPRAAHSRDRPVVYATLGTIFNELATFRLLLDALESIDCDVVMTIGRNRSPADLQPIPGNATIASYIPQAEVLDGCDAVIAHGGSGSFLAALAYGRPLVLLPRGADQFDNAEACRRLGVAEVILPSEATVESLRESITNVLMKPTYAAAARSVAAEIATMPAPTTVAKEIRNRVSRSVA